MNAADAATIILTARTRSCLSQGELARRSGVPQSVLSAYEHGRRQPSAAALIRIIGAAGQRLIVTEIDGWPPAPKLPDPDEANRVFLDIADLIDAVPRTRRRDRLRYPRLPG